MKRIIGYCLLSFAIASLVTWVVSIFLSTQDLPIQTNLKETLLIQEAKTLLHLDQILGTSLRNYSESGDPLERERFDKFLPLFTANLTSIIEGTKNSPLKRATEDINGAAQNLSIAQSTVLDANAPQNLDFLEEARLQFQASLFFFLERLRETTSMNAFEAVTYVESLQYLLLSVVFFFIFSLLTLSLLLFRLKNKRFQTKELLDARIKQRTKELEEAKEKAESASRYKTQFISNISHELRTPLNGVIGGVDLLKKCPLDEKAMKYCTIIDQSGHILLDLITELIQLSEIEKGIFKVKKVPFNLFNLLKDLTKVFQERTFKKDISLSLDYENGCPKHFISDPLRIKQIFLYLIDNAVKFTDKGTITVSITKEGNYKDKHLISVQIKDPGPGIPEDEQMKIFEPFYQVENYLTREHGGVGLGLTNAKKMIDLLDGTITLESQPGKGTTIQVTLPMKVDLEMSVKTLIEEGKDVHLEQSSKTNLPVLIVEDNLLNLELLSEILSELGYPFHVARDGYDALLAMKEQEYSLVFMDMQLPKMNGVEATKKIRQMEKTLQKKKPVPIIAITANAFDEDRELCLSSGMNDFLNKPINMEKTEEMLKKHLFLLDIRKIPQ